MFVLDHQKMSTIPSLKEVTTQLDQWRSTRTKQGKIPDVLWKQILTLLHHHPIGRLTRALKISSGQIKNKTQQASISTKVNSKQDKFLSITIPEAVSKTEPQNSGKVEIRRPDGAVLVIEQLELTLFTHVLTQFMEGIQRQLG